MNNYDVIFIGSGHACNHGAFQLAAAGKKVAIIEQGKNGGTCTNYGCDAKIILDGPFEYREGLQRYDNIGVKVPEINWSALMEYKKKVLSPFDPMLEKMFSAMKIDEHKGHGRLVDAHTVEVNGEKYTADYIVIGAGCRDSKLSIPGEEFIHGSKDFLDLASMPKNIVFIGAGIITMEFACMALDLGSKVTIIAHGDRALRQYPDKYVSKIVEKMEKQGAEFKWNENVSCIEKTDAGYKLATENGLTIMCDYVMEGTGRIANIEDLGLEELGIKASRKGIEVDDHLRTSVPNIYASGDVVNKRIPKLTPTAEFESNYIAAQILGKSDAPIAYPAIPNLVFTLPRIAQVGITIDEARKNPESYRIVEVPFGLINEWVNNRELDASHTYIIDKEGHLAGAALYSSEAGMMLDVLTLVINCRLTGADLEKMIFAFPTQTYSMLSGLIQLMNPLGSGNSASVYALMSDFIRL